MTLDIEDLSRQDGGDNGSRSAAGPQVTLHTIGKRSDKLDMVEAALSSNVPGTQSVWVKTFGCSHNVSDSEYMMGQLQAYGYK